MTARFVAILWATVACTLPFAAGISQGDEPAPAPPLGSSERAAGESGQSRSAEIAALIERLGHPDYPERMRARAELSQMGLVAFDALHAAQFHLDNEIATAARRLISSLRVRWSTETDTRKVREILKDYGTLNEVERRTQIRRLGRLPDRQGLRALCRLVRYETSLRLSRDAALEIMREPLKGATATARQDAPAAAQIREVLGDNQRRAADWLRHYADDLETGTYQLAEWREAIAAERRAVDTGQRQDTDASAVLELLRVCAIRASWAGQRDEAQRLAAQSLDLIPPGRRGLLEAVNWALESNLSGIVLQLRDRHPDRFADDPLLLYSAAETYLRQGDAAQARALSAEALAIEPLPEPASPAAAAMSADEQENIAYRHREVGRILQSRGRYEWALQEYQHIVDRLAVDVEVAATTRKQLASLQAELQDHEAVTATLQPLADRLRSDNAFARRIQAYDLMASEVFEMLAFHQGLVEAAAGNLEAAHELLLEAYTFSGEINADTLIAMYRTPGDASWRQRVEREVEVLTALFEQQIRRAEENRRRGGQESDDADLAIALNQYAWLVSNTIGDTRQALQASLRSLQLSPEDPMLLDTCARCYFALGELEQAIATQRRATELMPHQPSMDRQLAEFIEAREADEAAPAADAQQPDAEPAKPEAAKPAANPASDE